MGPALDMMPTVSELWCAALNTSISNRIAFPGSTAYNESLNSYFGVNAQLPPSYVALPLPAQDASVAVQILISQPEHCLIAIRSGGHTTSLGASAIEAGVTMDLSGMNTTTYDSSTNTASIQPGARWGSVYETLLQDNVLVPGGRTASVGVGGYLTGGGNSFHAARVGLACLSIKGYEVVLADGEIARVDQDSHPNLFRALKGGSNNFGIVTLFDMEAFSTEGTIWGGISIYWDDSADDELRHELAQSAREQLDEYARSIGAYNEYIYLNMPAARRTRSVDMVLLHVPKPLMLAIALRALPILHFISYCFGYIFVPYNAEVVIDPRIPALYNITTAQTLLPTDENPLTGYYISSFLTTASGNQYYMISGILGTSEVTGYGYSILDLRTLERVAYGNTTVYSASETASFNLTRASFAFFGADPANVAIECP
ncbi:hypothetical protein BDW72DRAFT_195552 [Aspergillus terricola var. indicus]